MATTTARRLVLQHEFDDEPSYLVWEDDRDGDLITVAPGNHALAARLRDLYNASLQGEANDIAT